MRGFFTFAPPVAKPEEMTFPSGHGLPIHLTGFYPIYIEERELLPRIGLRLPLYYCWQCCADHLTYMVIDGKRIKVLRNEGAREGDDFLYPNFPDSFPSRSILG
jgi:hypothetical protein